MEPHTRNPSHHLYTPESCINQNATRPRNRTELRETDKPRATEERGGGNPDGESARAWPWSNHLEGIRSPAGRNDRGRGLNCSRAQHPLGEGKSGVISGDKVGEDKGTGGFGRSAGAAEMVEVGTA